MNEMMFGSGSPVWTGTPPVGLAYQPLGIGNPAMTPPMFGSPMISGGIGGGSAGAQGLPAPGPLSPPIYGYGAASTPGVPQFPGGQTVQPYPGAQTFPQYPGGQTVAMAFPFGANPGALIGAEPAGFVAAPMLLAAVAFRRGQLQGPTNDQEVEEFIDDALDLLPGAADVEARCENGRATLTGSVHHKRTKRDAGEIAWSIPGIQDVQNNVSIASRHRARTTPAREAEAPPSSPARKQGS
jgi:hypothetical protein